jgi:hypothetical protein
MFRQYMHVERLESEEVAGLLDGQCHIFPKIDGTNGSIWLDEESGNIYAGSRKRQLIGEKDNFDFYTNYLLQKTYNQYADFFLEYPYLRLYGEYLVPHTLRIYRKDAWGKFYIFDVFDEMLMRFVPYEDYVDCLKTFDLTWIPELALVDYPTMDDLVKLLDLNTYLIQDGAGIGEGLVIKRYDFVNPYGRTVWAKLVKTEFKEENKLAFGVPHWKKGTPLEAQIAELFITTGRVEKTLAKMNSEGPWTSKRIPELFGRVYNDIVEEEMWEIIKRWKDPIINFRRLRSCIVDQVKKVKPELF